MGHTQARVKLINPATLNFEEHELLVDTDSTYSWVAKDVMEKLGISPQAKWAFRTIDGRVVKRRIGEVVLECMGERATSIVVFAEKGDANVLGVYALEGLRLEVEPVTKRLRKVEALLAI